MDETFSLGTLASKVVISAVVGDVVKDRAWVSSVLARWSLANFTPGADIGPVLVGVAHSDYASNEIEAWIENQDSWDEGNLVQQEIARRKIRMVGTFMVDAAVAVPAVLNDGKPILTKCGWILNQGQTIRLWAYNMGTAAIGTTDPVVGAFGHANIWPR